MKAARSIEVIPGEQRPPRRIEVTVTHDIEAARRDILEWRRLYGDLPEFADMIAAIDALT